MKLKPIIMGSKIILFAFIISLFSCKSKPAIDPDKLPKDISERPARPNQQQVDSEKLATLKAEITSMINTEPCTNPSKWKISQMGSKACGGPTEYIAYPLKIESEILPKITTYTQLQSAFNKKYEIVSDCAMVLPPSEIRCENGKAILVHNSEAVQK